MGSIARVTVAKSAGFCFGVRRAINLARESAPAYTLGPLIHNRHAVSDLEKEGVFAKEAVDEIPCGAKCVIRSHGVDKRTMEALVARAEVVDATWALLPRWAFS